jgi:hypothetical protein
MEMINLFPWVFIKFSNLFVAWVSFMLAGAYQKQIFLFLEIYTIGSSL